MLLDFMSCRFEMYVCFVGNGFTGRLTVVPLVTDVSTPSRFETASIRECRKKDPSRKIEPSRDSARQVHFLQVLWRIFHGWKDRVQPEIWSPGKRESQTRTRYSHWYHSQSVPSEGEKLGRSCERIRGTASCASSKSSPWASAQSACWFVSWSHLGRLLPLIAVRTSKNPTGDIKRRTAVNKKSFYLMLFSSAELSTTDFR
jgi:hypothetical protein